MDSDLLFSVPAQHNIASFLLMLFCAEMHGRRIERQIGKLLDRFVTGDKLDIYCSVRLDLG